jgi:hypothetical protein
VNPLQTSGNVNVRLPGQALLGLVTRLFLLLRSSVANNLGDYYQIYPEDEYDEEFKGDNARVWRVYNDEADRIDAEMVAGWRGTLDTLLIFVRIDFLMMYHCEADDILGWSLLRRRSNFRDADEPEPSTRL